MKTTYLNDIPSTNAYLMALSTDTDQVVVAAYQSAGRGMGKNSWESESEKNLLFSVLIHPYWLPAAQQFLVSMAHALSLYEVLSGYADGFSVKWPNDIYFRDRKISGTLIEGSLLGDRVGKMVIGTGLNVNQRVFRSDAPNPVSLSEVVGHDVDREKLLSSVIEAFEFRLAALQRELAETGSAPQLMAAYHAVLYRRAGSHLFEDESGRFVASIESVAPNGLITLRRTDGRCSVYAIKQLRFILSE